jgi:DNA-binding NarL/FixJ family response regulator
MDSQQKIRVLIVDDHPLMRSGIAGEVGAQSDMQVVSEASEGAEAVTAFELHRPDVTLMDIRMPGMGGIEATTRIRRSHPGARIVVLTTASGDIQALRAFQAGAVGYLLKNLLRIELLDTIRLVHAGRRRIPPEIALQLAEHATDDLVSARELAVLREVAGGKSNKIVASALDITEHTVKNHMKSILSKLGASDRTDAVVIALRRGYIDI